MAEDNRNSSRVFLGGVVISTVVGLGLLALIFAAVAPKGSPAPEASTPAQTAASPAATSTAQTATAPAGGTTATSTATSGAATSGTPAPSGAESNGTAANGTAAGGAAGAAGTLAGGATTSSGNAAENGAGTGAENSTARPAGNSQSGAGATATTQAAASQEKQQLQPVSFTGANGAELYVQACQSCHMPGGRGAQGAGRYPALANNARTASAPYVMTMVLNGHGGMPGFGHYLSDQQIAEIVNYVRDDLNKQKDRVAPADVKQLRPQNPDYTIFGESAG